MEQGKPLFSVGPIPSASNCADPFQNPEGSSVAERTWRAKTASRWAGDRAAPLERCTAFPEKRHWRQRGILHGQVLLRQDEKACSWQSKQTGLLERRQNCANKNDQRKTPLIKIDSGQGENEKAAWQRSVSTAKLKTSCHRRLPFNKPRFLWREDLGMTPLHRARCFR